MRRSIETLGLYLRQKWLKVFIYKSFASLHWVYLEAAPIPYVQDTISNPPNPYLRGTTVPLDKAHTCTNILSPELLLYWHRSSFLVYSYASYDWWAMTPSMNHNLFPMHYSVHYYNLWYVYKCLSYWTTALLSEMFLVWFRDTFEPGDTSKHALQSLIQRAF